MRAGRSVYAAVVAIAAIAGCTHDFGSFSVEPDDAATTTHTDAGDAGAPPSDAGASDAPSDATSTCGSGVSFGGHCYFAASAQGSWDASRAACAAVGAHLVTLGSAGEQAAVAPIAMGQDRWIGLYRAGDAGATSASSFSWITGEPNTFANWTAGEPNGSGPCVRMKTDGTWADQTCAMSLAAICEHE